MIKEEHRKRRKKNSEEARNCDRQRYTKKKGEKNEELSKHFE